MAQVVMRNRVTTEYRKIEKDSEEFWALRAELHADGRPRWEQTGEHDLAAFAARVEAGALVETDVGDSAQPDQLSTVAPEFSPQLDVGHPTPGEIEQGAGRAADMDPDELERLRRTVVPASGGVGFPAGHAPQITDEDGQPVEEEDRVEVGVSDSPVPDNTPTPESPAEAGASTSTSSGGRGSSKEELEEAVAARGLEVEGSGSGGNVTKADLEKALREDEERTLA